MALFKKFQDLLRNFLLGTVWSRLVPFSWISILGLVKSGALGQYRPISKSCHKSKSIKVSQKLTPNYITSFINVLFPKSQLKFKLASVCLDDQVDAKRTPSYFLRPTYLSIIIKLSDLWWQYWSEILKAELCYFGGVKYVCKWVLLV